MRSTRNGLLAVSAAAAIVLSCAATSPAATANAVPITKAPVAVGTGGAVASDDVEATSAGLDVLRHGGNAIDAAVAVAATLGVADPFVAGIGGGGYLVYYNARTGQVSTIDGRETAPALADANLFIDPATGKPAPYGSVGVDINCAVIGFTAHAPTANLAPPAPNSQFPPR